MTKLQMLCSSAGREMRRFGNDRSGATSIEYAMIAAGVSAFVIGAVTSLGSELKTTFYDKLAALLN